MTNEITKQEQSNFYRIFDSMGRRTEITICASNIKEACQIAKTKIKEIGSSFYKVKRCYNGGVRG